MSSRARKIAIKKSETSHHGEKKPEVKHSGPQMSTVISDLVLSVTSFACAYQISNQTFIGYFGFLIIGLAAFVGACKFTGLHQLEYFHKLASMTATTVGVPLMGLAFVHIEKDVFALKVSVYITLTFILATGLFYLIKFNAFETIAPLIGIVAAIYASIEAKNYVGVAGAILFIIAGLVIGTAGKIGPFRRVDVFHYALAASNGMLALALTSILKAHNVTSK